VYQLVSVFALALKGPQFYCPFLYYTGAYFEIQQEQRKWGQNSVMDVNKDETKKI